MADTPGNNGHLPSTVRINPGLRREVPEPTPTDLSGPDDERVSLTWPFSDLPKAVSLAAIAEMQTVQFEPGSVILHQGQPGPGLVVLVDGTVRVQVEDRGRQSEVAEVHAVTILGEMGLVTDEICTATVIAKTPVSALILPSEAFQRLAHDHNVLWLALHQLIADRLGLGAVDVLSGKIFHGYRIVRPLGRGGMAVVYEAEGASDGRRVALKMMSHRLTHDFEAQTRFQREGEICRSLEHRNILRTYDCFTSFATNFLVMEYCDGVSLADVIRHHGALAEDSVRKILGQLAAALNYAHTRGICHRDLKPSNILLDRQGTLKLADFGLARFVSSSGLTLEGRILGTPQYMAPEQLTGSTVDQRTDIFATGCIVWEMVTGKPLFSKADLFEILSFHQDWTLPPAEKIVPGLSRELHDVLRQSLARKQAERTLDLGKLGHWADAADPALVEV